MQPRGQLWFALQRICDDFRDFSGLPEREAVHTLVLVLRNLLADQETALARLNSGGEGTELRDPRLPSP
jgi:hypothetical protein